MKITDLTLRDLEYIQAVAELRNFGKAALACHVSQPALSTQIKKIEEILGVTLFERSQHSFAITGMGEAIAKQAKAVLNEAEKIIGIASLNQEPLSGRFRLGAIATLGPYFFPHVLLPLKKRFKSLELFLREGHTDELVEALRAGELDAVIASPTFDDAGLTRIDLFFEPFLIAFPKDHAIAGKTSIRSTDLNTQEMILLEEGNCLRDQSIAACSQNRRGHINELQATSLETLRQLVAVGQGYALFPALAVGDGRSLRSMVDYREFDGKAVGRILSVFCRKTSTRSKDIRLLADFFRTHAPAAVNVI